MAEMTLQAICPECNKMVQFSTSEHTNDAQCQCGVRMRFTVENGEGRVNVLGEWAEKIETKPARKVVKKAAKKVTK